MSQNKRARAHTPPVPRIDTMGLKRLNDSAKRRWDRLTRPVRQIQETKFACRLTLEQLGIGCPVHTLLNKVGLVNFLANETVPMSITL